MALPLWLVIFVGGRRSQRPGPSSRPGSIGPFYQRRHKSRMSFMAPLLQPLLAPLNWLGHFSFLARVTSVNPSHSAMLMVSSPKTRTPKHSGFTTHSVTNGVMWTSIHGSSILGWSPYPPSTNILSLYQKLGPSRDFSIAAGARSLQQLQIRIASTYDLAFSQPTTLSSSTFHVNVDRYLTFPIRAIIEDVMIVWTFAVSLATLRPLLFQGVVSGQHPTQIGISLSSHLQMKCFWTF
jgi:hypothetical protein